MLLPADVDVIAALTDLRSRLPEYQERQLGGVAVTLGGPTGRAFAPDRRRACAALARRSAFADFGPASSGRAHPERPARAGSVDGWAGGSFRLAVRRGRGAGRRRRQPAKALVDGALVVSPVGLFRRPAASVGSGDYLLGVVGTDGEDLDRLLEQVGRPTYSRARCRSMCVD